MFKCIQVQVRLVYEFILVCSVKESRIMMTWTVEQSSSIIGEGVVVDRKLDCEELIVDWVMKWLTFYYHHNNTADDDDNDIK